MDILSKIIKYECSVFEEFCLKRKELLEHIKSVKTNELDRKQMMIFVHDIKAIIEPIKTSISEIDYYFTNTDFKNNESIKQFNFIYTLLCLREYISTEPLDETDADDTEISDSEPESESPDSSNSETSSSKSVSVTFSSKNLLV